MTYKIKKNCVLCDSSNLDSLIKFINIDDKSDLELIKNLKL